MSKRKRFRPEMTVFSNSSKILPLLLDDIVNCYQKGYNVCKFCYYRKQLANTLSKQRNGYFCSNCNSLTKTVWLIPSSQFCENFGNFKELPIPSAPKWAYEKKDKPFTMCTRRVHHGCFEMSANSEVWFAHTIEELAIWTIEREYNCSFAMYIEKCYYGGEENFSGKNKSQVEKPLMVQDIDYVVDSDEVLDPTCVMFDRIEDIPKNLLEDVINNYKKAIDCCRFCYYYYSEVKVDQEWKDVLRCKECKRNWSSIKVIPASKLCQNFASLELVPISIPVNSDDEYSYEYCNKPDHYRCFENGAENGFKYAHSIEELVVWTVERVVGLGNFFRYINGEVTVNQSRVNSVKVTKSSNARNQTDVHKPMTYIAGGANVYTTIESLPQELLLSVGQCYERRLNVCRACFFDSLQDGRFNSNPTLSSKVQDSSMCERGHYWKGMRVIPASSLCKSYGTYIGIPPYPHHMGKSRNPFQVCKYHNHNDCYQKTREIDPWFPHSLEEIVIWTVERETGQDFKNYITRMPTHVQASPIRPSNRSPVMASQMQQGTVGNRDGIGFGRDGIGFGRDGIGFGRDSRSPMLDTAIETLVEGMQDLIPQHPSMLTSNNRAGNKVKMFTGYEPSVHSVVASSSPLLFMDDDSDEECSAGGNGETRSLTDYFPALAKGGGGHVTSEDITVPRPTDVNPYINQELQVPPADFSVPPPQFPIGQPLPPSAFPVTTPSVVPLSLDPVPQMDKKGCVVLTSDDDDQVTYECYLCYREFQSAERLANHTTKSGHVDLMRKDFCSRDLWQYFPYPPDQGPEDFTICTRSDINCPGRLKCCSAHSVEEREEWMLRYHHRNGSVHNHGNTPTEVIEKCSGGGVALSPNMNVSSYNPFKVGVKQLKSTNNTPKWRLTVAGQGWQTLLGLLCVSCEDNENRFEISAVKGDTIYTMRPQSSVWVAPSFDKGILLGCIQVIIRGVSVPVGSCDCRVKLHLGLQKYLCVELQSIVNY